MNLHHLKDSEHQSCVDSTEQRSTHCVLVLELFRISAILKRFARLQGTSDGEVHRIRKRNKHQRQQRHKTVKIPPIESWQKAATRTTRIKPILCVELAGSEKIYSYVTLLWLVIDKIGHFEPTVEGVARRLPSRIRRHLLTLIWMRMSTVSSIFPIVLYRGFSQFLCESSFRSLRTFVVHNVISMDQVKLLSSPMCSKSAILCFDSELEDRCAKLSVKNHLSCILHVII